MDTKERNIILQCRALIFKYGVKSLTMDDIAQQMGISKKTLYQYFENKADLVRKVMDFTISEHKEGVCQVFDENLNAIEEVIAVYKRNAEIVKQLNPSLDFELRKYYPESWALLESLRKDFIYKTVLDNLNKGIGEGLYREDMNQSIIAKLYTARVLDIINTELFPPDEFTQQMIMQEMFRYHLRGICTEKGLDFFEKQELDSL